MLDLIGKFIPPVLSRGVLKRDESRSLKVEGGWERKKEKGRGGENTFSMRTTQPGSLWQNPHAAH